MVESDSDSEEDDIYENLPDFKYDETIKKLESVNEELEQRAQLLEKQLHEKTEENLKLKEENHQVYLNFSSLLKTASNELQRKDRTIDELRQKFDKIVFRRKKTAGKGKSLKTEGDENPPIDHHETNEPTFQDPKHEEISNPYSSKFVATAQMCSEFETQEDEPENGEHMAKVGEMVDVKRSKFSKETHSSTVEPMFSVHIRQRLSWRNQTEDWEAKSVDSGDYHTERHNSLEDCQLTQGRELSEVDKLSSLHEKNLSNVEKSKVSKQVTTVSETLFTTRMKKRLTTNKQKNDNGADNNTDVKNLLNSQENESKRNCSSEQSDTNNKNSECNFTQSRKGSKAAKVLRGHEQTLVNEDGSKIQKEVSINDGESAFSGGTQKQIISNRDVRERSLNREHHHNRDNSLDSINRNEISEWHSTQIQEDSEGMNTLVPHERKPVSTDSKLPEKPICSTGAENSKLVPENDKTSQEPNTNNHCHFQTSDIGVDSSYANRSCRVGSDLTDVPVEATDTQPVEKRLHSPTISLDTENNFSKDRKHIMGKIRESIQAVKRSTSIRLANSVKSKYSRSRSKTPFDSSHFKIPKLSPRRRKNIERSSVLEQGNNGCDESQRRYPRRNLLHDHKSHLSYTNHTQMKGPFKDGSYHKEHSRHRYHKSYSAQEYSSPYSRHERRNVNAKSSEKGLSLKKYKTYLRDGSLRTDSDSSLENITENTLEDKMITNRRKSLVKDSLVLGCKRDTIILENTVHNFVMEVVNHTPNSKDATVKEKLTMRRKPASAENISNFGLKEGITVETPHSTHENTEYRDDNISIEKEKKVNTNSESIKVCGSKSVSQGNLHETVFSETATFSKDAVSVSISRETCDFSASRKRKSIVICSTNSPGCNSGISPELKKPRLNSENNFNSKLDCDTVMKTNIEKCKENELICNSQINTAHVTKNNHSEVPKISCDPSSISPSVEKSTNTLKRDVSHPNLCITDNLDRSNTISTTVTELKSQVTIRNNSNNINVNKVNVKNLVMNEEGQTSLTGSNSEKNVCFLTKSSTSSSVSTLKDSKIETMEVIRDKQKECLIEEAISSVTKPTIDDELEEGEIVDDSPVKKSVFAYRYNGSDSRRLDKTTDRTSSSRYHSGHRGKQLYNKNKSHVIYKSVQDKFATTEKYKTSSRLLCGEHELKREAPHEKFRNLNTAKHAKGSSSCDEMQQLEEKHQYSLTKNAKHKAISSMKHSNHTKIVPEKSVKEREIFKQTIKNFLPTTFQGSYAENSDKPRKKLSFNDASDAISTKQRKLNSDLKNNTEKGNSLQTDSTGYETTEKEAEKRQDCDSAKEMPSNIFLEDNTLVSNVSKSSEANIQQGKYQSSKTSMVEKQECTFIDPKSVEVSISDQSTTIIIAKQSGKDEVEDIPKADEEKGDSSVEPFTSQDDLTTSAIDTMSLEIREKRNISVVDTSKTISQSEGECIDVSSLSKATEETTHCSLVQEYHSEVPNDMELGESKKALPIRRKKNARMTIKTSKSSLPSEFLKANLFNTHSPFKISTHDESFPLHCKLSDTCATNLDKGGSVHHTSEEVLATLADTPVTKTPKKLLRHRTTNMRPHGSSPTVSLPSQKECKEVLLTERETSKLETTIIVKKDGAPQLTVQELSVQELSADTSQTYETSVKINSKTCTEEKENCKNMEKNDSVECKILNVLECDKNTVTSIQVEVKGLPEGCKHESQGKETLSGEELLKILEGSFESDNNDTRNAVKCSEPPQSENLKDMAEVSEKEDLSATKKTNNIIIRRRSRKCVLVEAPTTCFTINPVDNLHVEQKVETADNDQRDIVRDSEPPSQTEVPIGGRSPAPVTPCNSVCLQQEENSCSSASSASSNSSGCSGKSSASNTSSSGSGASSSASRKSSASEHSGVMLDEQEQDDGSSNSMFAKYVNLRATPARQLYRRKQQIIKHSENAKSQLSELSSSLESVLSDNSSDCTFDPKQSVVKPILGTLTKRKKVKCRKGKNSK